MADNDIGRLLEDLILQGGVDTSFIRWAPFDGWGRRRRQLRLRVIYALLQHWCLAMAVEYGAAHGALAMTTSGDTLDGDSC